MADAYIKIGWENEPSKKTSMSAGNLGHMDDGIEENRILINQLEEQMSDLEVGAVNWDTLKGKPFYEEITTLFEWDGDVTGLEFFNGEVELYKISDTPISKEELLGATITVDASGADESIEITEDVLTDGGTYLAVGSIFWSVLEDTDIGGVTLTTGIWSFNADGVYVKSIIKETVKPLDIKFIPDELFTKIDNRIDAYIEEALGGEY